MSPSKGTKRRGYRAPDVLYEAAQARAAARGETLTDVILRALASEHVTLTLTGGDTLDGGAAWTCPCGAVNLVPTPRESGPVTLHCEEEET